MFSVNPSYKRFSKWFFSSEALSSIKYYFENPCRDCSSYDGDKSGGCSLSSDEKCPLLQDK